VVIRVILAICAALAVPVAQLQTTRVVIACCCPDPSNCHCPDHKADHSGQSSLRACHRTRHDAVSPEAPSFTPTAVAIAAAPMRAVHIAMTAPTAPHEAPAADEPYGPS
jgi:hypothetical protein